MAHLTNSGIEELAKLMREEAATTDDRAARVIQAGAEVLRQAWKDTILEKNIVQSGQMANSVRAVSGKANAKGPAWGLVFASGEARYAEKGRTRTVRNGMKAAILYYGTSKNNYKTSRKDKKYPGRGIPALRFIDDAEARADAPLLEAMRSAWQEEK